MGLLDNTSAEECATSRKKNNKMLFWRRIESEMDASLCVQMDGGDDLLLYNVYVNT